MWRAFVLCLVAFTLSGAQQPKSQQPKAAETQQQSQQAPAPPPQYAPYSNWQEEACYNAKDHDAADLCAQWRSAVAAEKTAHEAHRATTWSIVATLFSALALGALLWTLIQTERALAQSRIGNRLSMRQNARNTLRAIEGKAETAVALAAAQKSAEAAAGQVEIAQDTAYRQLRAYLSIDEASVTAAAEDYIRTRLMIRNAGNTPATISLFLNHWIGRHPLGELPAEAPEPIRFAIHNPFINARSVEKVESFYPFASTPAETAKKGIEAMLAEPVNTTLYVYGRVEFLDFQRHLRILNFAYRQQGLLKFGAHESEMATAAFGNGYEDRGIQP